MNRKPWIFSGLIPRGYDLIVVDPPWPFVTWGPNRKAPPYKTMTLPAIKALPLWSLMARDCVVFLWTTSPHLDSALDCLRAWGLTYKSHMIWRKVTAKGGRPQGTGYWTASQHEIVLIGTRGRGFGRPYMPSCFDGVRRAHSRKPDEFFHIIERVRKGRSSVELFSRERRPGYDGWGDQYSPVNIRQL